MSPDIVAFNWNIFTQFGIAGLILGVLLMVIVLHGKAIDRMIKSQEDASEKWRLTFEAEAIRADKRQAETNEILRAFARKWG